MIFRQTLIDLTKILPYSYREWLRNQFGRSSRVSRRLVKYFDGTVDTGPFTGLRFLPNSCKHSVAPMLIGSYESELHDEINYLRGIPLRTIVDVGAAEGYYAVGLAKNFSQAHVIAFEMLTSQRERCRKLAILNGVEDRVEIRMECTKLSPEDIGGESPMLIICDCEGFEACLFDETTANALRNAYLIIELHEAKSPGVTEKLQSVFRQTHHQQMIPTTQRNPDDYPRLSFLPAPQRIWAINEHRGSKQHWLVLRPLSL